MASADVMKMRTFILLLLTLITFTITNVDPTLGLAYAVFIISYWVGLFSDRLVSFPFQRPGQDFFKDFLLFGLIGFGAFYISVVVIGGILQLTAGGLTPASVTSLFANIEPFLSGVAIVTFFVFTFLVTLAETNFFFGVIFELLLDAFNINKSIREPKAHLIAVTIAAMFAAFHITALGLAIGGGLLGNLPLIAAVIFGYISCLMVLYFRATIQASGTHAINNGIVVANKFGWLPNLFGG